MSELKRPQELYGQMFYDILVDDRLFGPEAFFRETKDFQDGIPRKPIRDILDAYKSIDKTNLDAVKAFLTDNFEYNQSASGDFDDKSDIRTHIKKLWNVLHRKPDQSNNGTLIPLKYDYFVPGGRFREVYYWDSYFSMLGLMIDHEYELAENLLKCFVSLIEEVGFIPNGNRTYYLGRSQPPFFSFMVDLYSQKDPEALQRYLPQLEKEYKYWMMSDGSYESNHCVKMKDGEILNRYCDKFDTPREEMYRNDYSLGKNAENPAKLYRDLRSAAESGWDFSSRWFADQKNLSTIHTTDIVPVDLNSLLYFLEKLLEKAFKENGNKEKEEYYSKQADKRKVAIIKYMWDSEKGFFFDYDFKKQKIIDFYSLAGVYPLYVNIADQKQAESVEKKVKSDFLRKGGVVTTLNQTSEQWDFPNGWAPLQWITYKAMTNYSFFATANEIRDRWLKMVKDVYGHTFKLLEKYNVVESSNTGGGEYPNQDGFGWTNGVYCAFEEEIRKN